MLLTKPQLSRFWREWSAIMSDNNWPHAESETQRRALLQRAGFSSLTQVDASAGFTAVLKELAILKDDLAGMLRADGNTRRQKMFLIQQKGASGYWRKIAQDRFGTVDLDALSDESLDQLLYTLSDRQVGQHQHATKRRRSATNRARRQAAQDNPEARIKLSAPDTAEHPHSDCGGYYCSEDHGHIDCPLAPVKSDPQPDPEHVPF